METLYVSFGSQWNLWDAFMVFNDKTEDEVREYMRKHYGNRYAFIYRGEDALSQIVNYSLRLVKPGVALELRYQYEGHKYA